MLQIHKKPFTKISYIIIILHLMFNPILLYIIFFLLYFHIQLVYLQKLVRIMEEVLHLMKDLLNLHIMNQLSLILDQLLVPIIYQGIHNHRRVSLLKHLHFHQKMVYQQMENLDMVLVLLFLFLLFLPYLFHNELKFILYQNLIQLQVVNLIILLIY